MSFILFMIVIHAIFATIGKVLKDSDKEKGN